MPAYRFPVLVWEGPAGTVTASLLRDEGNVTAVGSSAHEAVRLTREYVAWCDREGQFLSEPDLADVTLTTFKVPVRPEYKVGERILPCKDEIALHVPCVHAQYSGGMCIAHLPLLDHSFYYYADQGLKDLVVHTVRDVLQGRTPRQLSRFLVPPRVELREVAVQVGRKRRRRRPQFETTALKAVAEPLGSAAVARQFVRPWGREAETEDLVQRLGKERANVLLVGEAGAGKTTVLVDAVRRLERALRKTGNRKGEDARVYWVTSGARLIAGLPYLGQWEERAEAVIEELARRDGVLCLENLLETLMAGGRTVRDGVAAFLIPYLQSGELRAVAEATPSEVEACRRLLPGLVDLFQVLEVPDLSREASLDILRRLSDSCSQHGRIEVERGAVETAHRLFLRFAPYQAFPGRASRFLRGCFERVERARKEALTTEEVVSDFVRHTGLPELFLRDEVPLTRDEVQEAFRAQIIGQDRACAAATELVLTFKAGLNDPDRPLGVLLFTGPTGVGKTALARALSAYFFGHGEETDRLVRLDMSEYSGPGAAERLLGPPSGEPSELIKRLRRQPFCVLLLDEIEKAAPEVFDVLLGVFDEGRLTDRFGRTTSFRSAVVVLTSNLGAGSQQTVGFGDEPPTTYDHEVMRFFRPEFFNRIDRVVTFDPLGAEPVRRIAEKELRELAKREGLARHGLGLSWTEPLLEHVVARGFDTRYGARPLQRALETLVVTPLARFLIEHPDLRGGTVRVDVDDAGSVTFDWI